MKVKLDENVTYLAGALLTAAGHDVHTVQMEGLAGHPDAEVWSACLAERRLLITFDVGFGDLRVYPPCLDRTLTVRTAGDSSVPHRPDRPTGNGGDFAAGLADVLWHRGVVCRRAGQ